MLQQQGRLVDLSTQISFIEPGGGISVAVQDDHDGGGPKIPSVVTFYNVTHDDDKKHVVRLDTDWEHLFTPLHHLSLYFDAEEHSKCDNDDEDTYGEGADLYFQESNQPGPRFNPFFDMPPGSIIDSSTPTTEPFVQWEETPADRDLDGLQFLNDNNDKEQETSPCYDDIPDILPRRGPRNPWECLFPPLQGQPMVDWKQALFSWVPRIEIYIELMKR